jgi:hypothetical protein
MVSVDFGASTVLLGRPGRHRRHRRRLGALGGGGGRDSDILSKSMGSNSSERRARHDQASLPALGQQHRAEPGTTAELLPKARAGCPPPLSMGGLRRPPRRAAGQVGAKAGFEARPSPGQVRDRPERGRRTIRARPASLNETVEVADNAVTRGMLRRVAFLVTCRRRSG